jgi:hypothetical protein
MVMAGENVDMRFCSMRSMENRRGRTGNAENSEMAIQ